MEAYEKIKKTLAVAFMNDLNNNRPEGKMCLTNGECADIEKAFNEQDWPKLARYLDKYTESWDEWIRKSLINFLSSFELMRDDATFRKGDFDLDAIKGYISYLEKKNEQKLDIEPIQRSWYIEGYHDREFGKEPKWIVKTGEGGPRYEENPKYGQMLAEQKPVTFNEPYSPDDYEVVTEGNSIKI